MTLEPHGSDPATETAQSASSGRPTRQTRMLTLSLTVLALVVGAVAVLTFSPEPSDNDAVVVAPPTSTESGYGSAPFSDQTADTTTNGPRKILKLADHPLLQDPDVSLPNLVCTLPGWAEDPGTVKAFFRTATECLDRAWGKLLRGQDLPFTPPRLYFPTGSSFPSDCGTIDVGISTAAYYCEGELFLPFRGLQLEQYPDNPGVFLALIAHEYGHHVQELSGLMNAAWDVINQYGLSHPRGQEMSRRKELQAQCFSGMFLGSHVDRGGSINRDVYEEAWEDQATRGDNTSGGHDHGNNKNYAKWWREGAMDNRIVDCDTFKAGVDEVR